MKLLGPFCIVLLLCGAAMGATFNVNNTADEVDAVPGDGTCATAGGTCTLRAAVMEANALAGPHQINLPAGTYQLTLLGVTEDAAMTGDLDLLETVEIIGAGRDATTIDGLGLDRVFHVVAGANHLTLRNLSVVNGNEALGGGVYHTGPGNLTLTDARISDCIGTLAGAAALVASNGNIHIQNTRIENNTTGNVGAIAKAGTGFLDVIDSQIVNNLSLDSGAGIYNMGNGPMTIVNCQFSNNITQMDGGAVMHIGDAALNITGSQFQNNSAVGNGGAVFHTGNAPTNITSTVISMNNSSTGIGGGLVKAGDGDLTIVGSQINNNTAAGFAGGVLYNGINSSLSILNSQIIANSSLASAGGGILNVSMGPLTIENSSINDNIAGGDIGGGLVSIGPSASTIINSNFMRNTAVDAEGGGIYDDSNGNFTITNCTLAENRSVVNVGGGLFRTGLGALNMDKCAVYHNRALGGAGALCAGVFNASAAASVISNSTFSGNDTTFAGGGFCAFSDVTLIQNTFADNSAAGFGAAIANFAGTTTLYANIIAKSRSGINCIGAGITSTGNNIDDDNTCNLVGPNDQPNTDPLLAPLADNGGNTLTHALMPGSPAIDRFTLGCLATDQRGIARPLDGDNNGAASCDVGAFEFVDCSGDGADDNAAIASGALADCDNNGIPDVCEYPDTDGDGIADPCDSCTDSDGDGFGDPGFPANTCPQDNCPTVFNPDQADSNGNGIGDACEPALPAPGPAPCGLCGGGAPLLIMAAPFLMLSRRIIRGRRRSVKR